MALPRISHLTAQQQANLARIIRIGQNNREYQRIYEERLNADALRSHVEEDVPMTDSSASSSCSIPTTHNRAPTSRLPSLSPLFLPQSLPWSNEPNPEVMDSNLTKLIKESRYERQMPRLVDRDCEGYRNLIPDFDRIIIKGISIEMQIDNWLEVLDIIRYNMSEGADCLATFVGEDSWMSGAEEIDLELFRADRKEKAHQLFEHVNRIFFKAFIIAFQEILKRECPHAELLPLSPTTWQHRFFFDKAQEALDIAKGDSVFIQLCGKIKTLWVKDGLLDSTACENSLVYAQQLHGNE